jgi:hypothetical protein
MQENLPHNNIGDNVIRAKMSDMPDSAYIFQLIVNRFDNRCTHYRERAFRKFFVRPFVFQRFTIISSEYLIGISHLTWYASFEDRTNERNICAFANATRLKKNNHRGQCFLLDLHETIVKHYPVRILSAMAFYIVGIKEHKTS